MKNIIGIFVQRSSIFLLAIYVIISVVLMNFNDAFTQRGLRTVVLQFISWANSVENQKVYFRNLKKENRELKERLLQLSISNQQLQEVMIENIRLRRLLKFRSEHEYNYKAANVVGSSQEETVRSLILDVGSEDSIRKNLPVITDRGLVGKVLKTDKHYSIAQILWTGTLWLAHFYKKAVKSGLFPGVGISGWI
jgi:cell shape-determining protein MreC